MSIPPSGNALTRLLNALDEAHGLSLDKPTNPF